MWSDGVCYTTLGKGRSMSWQYQLLHVNVYITLRFTTIRSAFRASLIPAASSLEKALSSRPSLLEIGLYIGPNSWKIVGWSELNFCFSYVYWGMHLSSTVCTYEGVIYVQEKCFVHFTTFFSKLHVFVVGRVNFRDTVNSPLADILLSGQLYLRTLFSIPFLPLSHLLRWQ